MSIESKVAFIPAATSSDTYPLAPQIVLDFKPGRIAFYLDDTGVGKYAYFSFDGETDHAHVHAEHNIAKMDLEVGFQSIWVRGAGTCGYIVSATRYDLNYNPAD